jgi:hypothetical protein
MFVLVQVSSMKTSLPGFRFGCFSRHSMRALATWTALLARPKDFFICQVERAQRLAQQTSARRGLMRLGQPFPQLRDRGVGTGRHLRLGRTVQTSQLWRHMTSSRQRLSLPRPLPSRQNLRNIRDTDPQQARDLSYHDAVVGSRKNAFSQILRIRLPTLPKHPSIGFAITGYPRITDATRFASLTRFQSP